MNKFTKGTVAAGAGLLLLLGGGGSLAYWNAQAELVGSPIAAGTLTISAEDGLWNDAPAVWVPGDSGTFTTVVTLTATGDNIQGAITVDPDSVPDFGHFDFDLEVGTIGYLHGTGSFDETNGVFVGPDVYTIPLTLTVTLPFGDDVDNDSQGATLDLAGITFIATQTAATP